jgi:hypothetical protein
MHQQTGPKCTGPVWIIHGFVRQGRGSDPSGRSQDAIVIGWTRAEP